MNLCTYEAMATEIYANKTNYCNENEKLHPLVSYTPLQLKITNRHQTITCIYLVT